MRTFIIHTLHEKSKHYAAKCMESFKGKKNWNPVYFMGAVPSTLPFFEQKYKLNIKEKSRAMDFYKQNDKRFLPKKACSINHYRLFKECVKINEPIAIVEHDSYCIKDWDDHISFDDVLVLNAQSALDRKVMEPIWHLNKDGIPKGLNDLKIRGLNYRHDEELKHAYMIPGTAAYAITPNGAQKMLDVYENIGWEQSDFIINTAYVRIQTIIPEFFTFKLPNLSTSHGEYT